MRGKQMRITVEIMERKEIDIEHDEDYWICDSVLWKMRDEIDPPREGYVMYSSSGAEFNLECLIESGWKPEDLMVCTIAGHDTVWRYEGEED